MAKVTGPLFSMAASGTLAKTIVFVCGHLARIAARKSDEERQMPPGQNDKFIYGALAWQQTSGAVKSAWKEFNKAIVDSKVCVGLEYYLNGYQLWMSYYLTWGENGWPDYPNPGPPPES